MASDPMRRVPGDAMRRLQVDASDQHESKNTLGNDRRERAQAKRARRSGAVPGGNLASAVRESFVQREVSERSEANPSERSENLFAYARVVSRAYGVTSSNE